MLPLRKLSVRDVDLRNQTVIVRVDFNCPLSADGRITDNLRMVLSMRLIEYLLSIENVKIILMSHLGHPCGNFDNRYSLKPMAAELNKLLKNKVVVKFASDCNNALADVESLSPGQILLLENLRFNQDEEKNGSCLAKKLASYGSFFIDEAWGSSNRVYASNEGIAHYFPQKSCCGFLLGLEMAVFDKILLNPNRPFVGVLGGAKITEKYRVIVNLIEKVDYLVIGGGMANTFLRADGKEIGHSFLQADKLRFCKEMLDRHRAKIILPLDSVFVERLDFRARTCSGVEVFDHQDVVYGESDSCQLCSCHCSSYPSFSPSPVPPSSSHPSFSLPNSDSLLAPPTPPLSSSSHSSSPCVAPTASSAISSSQVLPNTSSPNVPDSETSQIPPLFSSSSPSSCAYPSSSSPSSSSPSSSSSSSPLTSSASGSLSDPSSPISLTSSSISPSADPLPAPIPLPLPLPHSLPCSCPCHCPYRRKEAVDIGPKTRALFADVIRRARTAIWNGPMGIFEIAALREGTAQIAKALADITRQGAFTVVGGGDTAVAIGLSGEKVSHVSTGGYASLEYLEGKTFPALEVLTDAVGEEERKKQKKDVHVETKMDV